MVSKPSLTNIQYWITTNLLSYNTLIVSQYLFHHTRPAITAPAGSSPITATSPTSLYLLHSTNPIPTSSHIPGQLLSHLTTNTWSPSCPPIAHSITRPNLRYDGPHRNYPNWTHRTHEYPSHTNMFQIQHFLSPSPFSPHFLPYPSHPYLPNHTPLQKLSNL